MSRIREAFFEVCQDAEPAKAHFLSLYSKIPFYGGPEEGGWWGTDTNLIAYQEFPTEEALEAAKLAVTVLAAELNRQAKRTFGEQCLRETEWLEARGLDDSYLPEVDGETKYVVVVEEVVGSREHRSCRHYE